MRRVLKKLLSLAVLLALPLAALPHAGCGKESGEAKPAGAVTFVNEAGEGDVWILPKTEQYEKTTVWGTAGARKVGTGERRSVALCEPGDGGLYLFRMIGSDGRYYSAGGVELSDGWTVRIRESGYEVFLDVEDGNGVLKNTYPVFSAML